MKIVNIRSTGFGDYRVPAPEGTEAASCYEGDRESAVDTAVAMWSHAKDFVGETVEIRVNGRFKERIFVTHGSVVL